MNITQTFETILKTLYHNKINGHPSTTNQSRLHRIAWQFIQGETISHHDIIYATSKYISSTQEGKHIRIYLTSLYEKGGERTKKT